MLKRFFIFLLIICGLYYATFTGPFFFDDFHAIKNNIKIQTPDNLLKILDSAQYYSVSPENYGYRPVTTVIHSLSWIAAGGATWPFHVSKKFAFALVCLLLMLVWAEIYKAFSVTLPQLELGFKNKKWILSTDHIAFILALIFAVHPANTQVVNYISASSSLFAGLFFILSFYLYLKGRGTKSWLLWFLSALTYFLSVMSKEEGVTLIAVVYLYEIFLYFYKKEKPVRTKYLLSYLGVFFISIAVLYWKHEASTELGRGFVTVHDYFLTQIRAWIRYFSLLFWPADLNADNLIFGFSNTILDPHVITTLVLNLLLLVVSFRYLKVYPLLLFSVLWFYIGVSPQSSVVPLAEPVNDHRMFIAYMGLMGGLTPLFLMLLDQVFRWFSLPALVAVLLALSTATFLRNDVWTSNRNLWADTWEKNPNSPRAANNLSLEFMAVGDWKKSNELIDQCLGLSPYYSPCLINKGIVMVVLNNEPMAESYFKQAMKYDPSGATAREYYGSFLMRKGRIQEAIPIYEQLMQITDYGNFNGLLNLANCYYMLGEREKLNQLLNMADKHFSGNPSIEEMKRKVH